MNKTALKVFLIAFSLLELDCFSQDKNREKHDSEAAVRIANFKMPADVKAELFADKSQTQNPGAICFDQRGRLFVAELHRWRSGVEDIRNEQRLLFDDIAIETNEERLAMYEKDQLNRPLTYYTEYSDRIVVIEDTDDDGRADSSRIWADGFNDILDGPGIGLLATDDGSIYYTNIPHLWRLEDTDSDGVADERESLQDGFGVRISFSGHDMHGLIQGPDGKIYWSIGDRGYSFTTKEGKHISRPMEGAVFRCDPDGSNLEEYHRGLRNPQELAFDQYGNLFTCDNDADYWDTGRLVYVMEGGDSGWNHGHQALMNFKVQFGLRTPDYDHPGHQSIPMSPWMTEGIWDPDQKARPDFALPAVAKVSWGPSGFVYNYGVTAMPDRYAEHFWICNFGGANGDLEAFTVEQQGAGFALGQHEKFMVGLGNTDVEFGPDGKMYLCCFNNNGWYKQDIGNIYTLFDEKTRNSEALQATESLLTGDFSSKTDPELESLLFHGDMRVRQRAQFELVTRRKVENLERAATQKENLVARLHGIWGLGQLGRTDDSIYRIHLSLLEDGDDEVRAQAAKVLADSRLEKAGHALAEALDDSSSRVKSFAALGIGKCRHTEAFAKILEMVAANDDTDPFLRHSLVQALADLGDVELLSDCADHDSAAVRLAAVLALRKLESPGVGAFLDDREERVRYSAIRAINDLGILEALPALADHIEKYIDKAAGFRMPSGHRDWIIQHRLINANFRLGSTEAARRLIAYAAAPHLPEIMRGQALDALKEWDQPTAVDPTVGFHRPLDLATREGIESTIQTGFDKVFDSANDTLLAKATGVALLYGTPVPEETLATLINNQNAPESARLGALRGLAAQNTAALDPMFPSLLEDVRAPIRAAASEILLAVDQVRGIATAFKMASSDEILDRQAAFRNLAGVADPSVGEFFAARLAAIDDEKPGAVLDLLEAAGLRMEDSVKAGIEAWKARHADSPLAEFDVCLEGGDFDRGKVLFLTHAAGQCAKCHRIGKDGGEAGPDLTALHKRSDKRYILESLIDPNKVVVPGYGIAMVTMTDGSSVGGVLVSEDEKNVVLKVSDGASGEMVEKSFPRSDVAALNPPISAMPPMTYLMKKQEIRDLIEYLSSPKKGKQEKGH